MYEPTTYMPKTYLAAPYDWKNLSIHLVLKLHSDNTKLPLFGANIPILVCQSIMTHLK